MKHNFKVISILLLMFIATQLIGLVVIDAYTPKHFSIIDSGVEKNITVSKEVPYGMGPPEIEPKFSLPSIIMSIAFAVLIFILLIKVKAKSLIKLWFTAVVFLTIAVSLTAIFIKLFPNSSVKFENISLVLAIPLTFYKIFRRNMVVHNLTELLVYPGIAVVFVPILGITSALILLVLISVYDMYAVWKSSLMVNLAKYQINNLKVFTGFFIPYLQGKDAALLRKIQKIKLKRERTAKLKKIKVALAILGGGDVAFSLIFAGVIYQAAGLIPALIIVGGSTSALLLLFMFSKKGKVYPAMPFITAGCIAAYLLTLLL